jgi:ribonuclease HI
MFSSPSDIHTPIDVEIWTDGACSNNGKPEAKASWAFVSGEYEEAGRVIGKQTNNMGEGIAVLKALEWAVSKGYKHVRLHTDSQITIFNLQKPARIVKANKELFEEIEKVIQENELVVQYIKVPGHADNVNNNRADKLANGLVGIKN